MGVITNLGVPGGSDIFTGTRAQWDALSPAQKAAYAPLVVINDEQPINSNIMFDIEDQTLTFTNKVATISDSRVTANTKAFAFYTDETFNTAKAADINVTTSSGTITFTATNTPTGTIVCDVIGIDFTGGGSGGSTGGMAARLMITSTVSPTVISPSGKTLSPVATSETNRYYCDTTEYGQHMITQTIGGTTGTVNINVRECKLYEVADKTTFEGIQQILNSHMETDLLEVGDEVSVTLTGNEPMTWVIGAINHEQQHQVIFVPKWCLSTGRKMNTSQTNVGGWNTSEIRTWLNGDFYNNLPDSVKPYIKDRTFQTSQGNQSTILQSATDKIWLPREWEIFGARTYAASSEHTDGGAEQFPIYAVTANRIKTLGQGGSASIWWESSPTTSSNAAFCMVNTSGGASYVNANYSTYGVAPCFHLTANI